MLLFKPRLALFYVLALVIISIVTNRLSISSQKAMADSVPNTVVNTCNATNVETSK